MTTIWHRLSFYIAVGLILEAAYLMLWLPAQAESIVTGLCLLAVAGWLGFIYFRK